MKRLVALGAVLMLVAAACGGGTADGDAASATTAATAAVTSTSQVDDDHSEEPVEGHNEEFIPPAAGEPTLELDVTLGEMFFEPDAIEVSTGQTVRFNLTNSGLVAHEFRLSSVKEIEEHIAAGHSDEGEGDHEDAVADVVVYLQPGEQRTVDITFPDDPEIYTTIACLVPGHFEAGMKGAVSYV